MANDSKLINGPVETRVSWESRGWSFVEPTDIYVTRLFAASWFLSLRLFAMDQSSIPIGSEGNALGRTTYHIGFSQELPVKSSGSSLDSTVSVAC
jgi:hypothetical protein